MNVYVREYQKIERKARRRDSFLVRYLPIVLLLAGGVVVGKIYLQSVAIEWSNRVVERRQVARDLELQNEDLKRTIAALSTRERVARVAGESLGMVTPTEDDVVWLPVLDRSPDGAVASRDDNGDLGPVATVRSWVDALWQEEALALTSR